MFLAGISRQPHHSPTLALLRHCVGSVWTLNHNFDPGPGPGTLVCYGPPTKYSNEDEHTTVEVLLLGPEFYS
eukprot:scaffold454123_cov35-Prasinocladus_malaysianus.AAC.1